MMIIDPVALGDVSCARASPKWVYDRTGTLVQVPANTLAVTYDPADLSKAPYALVEGAATNLLGWSADLSPSHATVGPNMSYIGTVDGVGGISGYRYQSNVASNSFVTMVPAISGNTTYTASYWLRLPSGVPQGGYYMRDDANGGAITSWGQTLKSTTDWQLVTMTFTAGPNSGYCTFHFGAVDAPAGYVFDICLAQFEVGNKATSRIITSGALGTRAADAIAPGAGLAYSNVPIAEPAYNAGTTYAQNAVVYDPATFNVYQSLIANNIGKALTDTTAWTPTLRVVNRRLMFDSYNSTQTSNAEEIIVVLTASAIAQGVYLGNIDGSEVRISVVDPTDGLVYQEVQNLVVSNSGSSFYNWCFKRIKRKSYAVSVQLPPYAAGLVTIAIKKPGGTPKCGMCVLGSLVDVGMSQFGLSREIKDYSTVNFNVDGTSNVVLRNFAKLMSVDVIVENDQLDSVIETLEGYRQKPVAWIGSPAFGSACLFGPYTSFKNVLQYPNESVMSLQIQGTV